MAIQRLNMSQIASNILEIMGYADSTLAPWKTDTTLYTRINEYGQRLPMRLNSVAKQLNLPVPVRLDMWRTVASSGTNTTSGCQVTAGSSTLYLPVDYDHYISFMNADEAKPIHVTQDTVKWESDGLYSTPPGIPKYIEILGYVTVGSNWRRAATLYPNPISSYTPSIRLEYWRLPNQMGISTSYPDIDPKYESLFIYGTVTDLSRSTGQEFDRYANLEKELLVEMISTARSL